MSAEKYFDNGIVMLGAGNVATHLAIALKKAGFEISYVFSKTLENARILAEKIRTNYTNDIQQLPLNADLYIISVKDEAIVEIIRNLRIESGIVVHTAGSISMNIFQNIYKEFGVIYPLQTFSKTRELVFSEIPVFIEANNKEIENKLFQLTSSLSTNINIVDSDKRKKLHLAAVFACNFVNHMYTIATKILNNTHISFDSLIPLINETAAKAIESNPENAQTGPAVRNDQNVIQKHLEMLSDYPEYEKIYKFVSESIYKTGQQNNKK